MTTAGDLKLWSERLCIATAAEPPAMIAALATPGAAVKEGEYLVIDPPPLGAKKVMVSGGDVPHVDIRRPGGPLTRADLDAEFGEGRTMPRVGFGAQHEVVYQVVVPGAPFRCSVFARFDKAPAPATSVETVILRIDRGAP